jgi:hypothetical protein
VQIASLLLFFLMYGYHLYGQNRDIGASLCWGIIIAMIIFPGIALIYALAQKRFKAFFTVKFLAGFMLYQIFLNYYYIFSHKCLIWVYNVQNILKKLLVGVLVIRVSKPNSRFDTGFYGDARKYR